MGRRRDVRLFDPTNGQNDLEPSCGGVYSPGDVGVILPLQDICKPKTKAVEIVRRIESDKFKPDLKFITSEQSIKRK